MDVSLRLTVANNLMSSFPSISKYKDLIRLQTSGFSSIVGMCLCVYKFAEEDKLISDCMIFQSVTWRKVMSLSNQID